MNPKELEKNYDKIAVWWTDRMKGSDYGVKFVRRALDLSNANGAVLDIGCGGERIIIEEVLKRNIVFICKKNDPDREV